MTKTIKTGIFFLSFWLQGQSNTAVSSGSIGKCGVWGYPYTLYNRSAATQNVGDGITVSVDQNRTIGAVVLSGSGALSLTGSNGITMSGASAEITCRWDIDRSDSHTVVNNDGNPDITNHFQNWGTFFTAPYMGDYIWLRSSGWAASMSGGILNGGVRVVKNNTKSSSYSIFFQNENGSCPAVGTVMAATWDDYLIFSMNPGDTFQYGGSTRYSNSPSCPSSVLNVTLGNAVIAYDN